MAVPKKNNKQRLTTNLTKLYSYTDKTGCKFHQEDIRAVCDIIKPNDYMTTIDLNDCFYHIPISKDYQDYFGFTWAGSYYV